MMRLSVLSISLLLVASFAGINAQCTKQCTGAGGKVLFWGATPAHFGGLTIVQWLNANVPSAQFDQLDPGSNTLTPSLLAQYDLVVLSELSRNATAAEASALWKWIENGGFFFGMSGWENGIAEVQYSNSYFVDFDGSPQYICAPTGDCTVSGCTNFYPDQPLLANINNCNLDYDGGYASSYGVSYSGTDTFSYLFYTSANGVQYNVGLQVDLCGSDHPNGGRMVFWGDEWISYTPRFTVNQDDQLWFNILKYLNLCISQCSTDADCTCGQSCGPYGTCICTDPSICSPHVATPTCSSASAFSAGDAVQLVFGSSGGCGAV